MPSLNSISSKQIVAKVIRDLHLQDADRWVDQIEWIGEAVAHIGAFDQFVNKNLFDIEVKNFRVALPCDLYSIIAVTRNGAPLRYLGGSFDFAFHCVDSPNLKSTGSLGYTVNVGYINTNFNDGTIHLAYQAFDRDEEGWPKIPNEVSYIEAVFRYIVMKMKYPEWISGRISDAKYEAITLDWHRYCAQARGTLNMPSIDQMEAIKNFWVNMVPNITQHNRLFNDLGLPGSTVSLSITPNSETVGGIG